MKIATITLFFLGSTAKVAGHGYMSTPRTRNVYASMFGGSGAGVPPPENCEHCLNRNDGVCAKGHENYDDWLDSQGNPMPWMSQDTFQAGEIIEVVSYMSTHHNGHIELEVCCNGKDEGRNCVQSDFDAHPATFVADISDNLWDGTGMPKDLNYPARGYLAWGQGGSVKDFKMLFQLPEDVYGEECLLQWWYVTANSCSPYGYADYFGGTSNEFGTTLPTPFWTPGLSECLQYPQDGSVGGGAPEQFWNCAEVTIEPAIPTASPAPTTTYEPTNSPTKSSAPSIPNGCCTFSWGDCVDWNAGMIEDRDLCLAYNEGRSAAEQVYWLPSGPYDSSECTLRWMGQNGGCPYCCPGLTCVQQSPDNDYMQCLLVEAEPTTPAPIDPPTTPAPVTPAPVAPPPFCDDAAFGYGNDPNFLFFPWAGTSVSWACDEINTNWRKNNKCTEDVPTNCARNCLECCSDDPTFTFINTEGSIMDCAWLAADPSRINTFCQVSNRFEVVAGCSATCDVCPTTNAPITLTPAPVTPAPVVVPVTPAPVTPAPVTPAPVTAVAPVGVYYCCVPKNDFQQDCRDPGASHPDGYWCSDNQGNCEGNCNGAWVNVLDPPQCLSWYAMDCDGNALPCCDGSTCTNNQCLQA